MDAASIDWSDPSAHVSAHFTVREATWLPSWGVAHIPSGAEKAAIVAVAARMDMVRDMLGKPIHVHVWIRPNKANCPGSPHDGGDYNRLVKGAPKSAHILGSAVDWDCDDDCDATRAILLPALERLGLRMEDNPGSRWVHNDDRPPNPNRFFPV